MTQVHVIMGNDYPTRVYDSADEAKAFVSQKMADPANHRTVRLSSGVVHVGQPEIYYRSYEFPLVESPTSARARLRARLDFIRATDGATESTGATFETADVAEVLSPTQVYRHLKRGSFYEVIGTAVYQGHQSAVEGQLLSIKTDPYTGLWIAALATLDGPVNHASLQATLPVEAGSLLVLYRSVVPPQSDAIQATYLRSTAEFYDGRFERVLP